MVGFGGLEQAIGYSFNDKTLLQQALTHKSYDTKNNERMEFVGDGILDYVIATNLYTRYPDLSEGDLSKIRSILVSQSILVKITDKIDLGNYLCLSDSEDRSGGRKKPSILADCLEAVFAAVALDSSVIRASKVIEKLYSEYLNGAQKMLKKDSKSFLQEYCQKNQLNLPEYEFNIQEDLGHRVIFCAICKITQLDIIACGYGKNKKEASQHAAELAIIQINSIATKIAG